MSLAAPNSEVDICNLALLQLKQDVITSIDPAVSDTEMICAQFYHSERRATLRSHPWNFAIKRAQLTEDTGNVPLFGDVKAYQLPSDFLRYLDQHDELGYRRTENRNFQIEGQHLILFDDDTDVVNIRYIYDHQVVARWDALFTKLFAINLAMQISSNFSASENRLSALAQLQQDIRTEARAIDGQERPPIRIQRSRFMRARRRRPTVASKYAYFEDHWDY